MREHSCFLKEVGDAQAIRKKIMDCVETATFKGQPAEEVERLLHMVVVGGGPTGVEFAGELRDFFVQDLKKWIPEIADKFRVTLVEALPNVRCWARERDRDVHLGLVTPTLEGHR